MRSRTIWSALAVLAGSLVAVEVSGPVTHAATVPPGFSDASIADVGSSTAIEWLPGDRIVVLEQNGRVRVARPGQAFSTAIDLVVCSNSERGLLGLAPDPGFLGNGLVYVYYTHPGSNGCVNRVSRFQMTGDSIDPGSEIVLLDNIASTGGNHNGGDIDVGSDGNLYIAVGDAGTDPRGDSGGGGSNDAAQDLSLLNGKILRVTRDGFPAPGNPISGSGTSRCAFRGNNSSTPTSPCQELFAWGLRNPYRFAFDRNDGSDRFFINDVGQRTFEEVNEGLIGRNYGWPAREGECPQGDAPPCTPTPSQYTDPITAYGRALGTYVTAGAFVPNGLWPAEYDGGYFFADGGSGNIWLRRANGSVDYKTPFATGAFGIVDMTFGFDADGRSVLYYVRSSGDVRVVTPTAKLPLPPVSNNLKMVPVNPFRAYDTLDGTGVAAGSWFNGTTRLVDLDPPANTRAALVNLTYAATAGPGFLSAWGTRGPRPGTSALNADRPFSFVANAAVVPLADDGSFVLESATSGRVIIDVMAWFQTTAGTSDDGRFVSLDPARLADTREPSGDDLDSGSPNPWARVGERIDVEVLGHLGIPDDGTAGAVVLSVGAISGGGPGGFVGAFPGGGTYSGTSNVNVLAGDIRANMMVVPLDGADHISLQTLNIAHVVVDVLGYVTTDAASTATLGLYTPIDAIRIVDTRLGAPFGTLQPLVTEPIITPGAGTTSAVAQTVTVTRTDTAGWVAAHTTAGDVPDVSTVNFTAADQTRAALAFTQVERNGREHATALVGTDLVVDVVGIFSD